MAEMKGGFTYSGDPAPPYSASYPSAGPPGQPMGQPAYGMQYSQGQPMPAQPMGYGQPPMQGYPPGQQPMGYHPGQQMQPTQTVVVVQPGMAVNPMSASQAPVRAQCPHCMVEVTTQIQLEVGMRAGLMAFMLCLICPCLFFVPLIMDQCKDPVHLCPQCKRVMGRYEPPVHHRRGRRY